MLSKIKEGALLGVGAWLAFQALNLLLSIGMYVLYLLFYAPPPSM